MGPLTVAYLILAGICLTMALLHIVISARGRESKTDLVFAALCLFSAGSAVFEILAYRADTISAWVSASRLQLACQGILWIILTWFIAIYTGATRRSLAWVVTGSYALAVVVNLFLPYTVLFSAIDRVETTILPWGESISSAAGRASLWRILPDIAWFLLMFLAAESCVRMARRGQKRRAAFFGAALFVYLGLAYLHDTLVDLEILSPPFVLSFAFLALIITMGASLTSDVASAAELSREVAANEYRWRSVMENVKLLAAGLDRNGRINYINPHFARVTGYAQNELLGKPIIELAPEQDREDVRERLEKAMSGDIRPHSTRSFLTKNGKIREINWFHVVQRDTDDRITGTLSIGEDVTELRQAQQALRDEKERMDVILSSLNTGLVLLDADLSVVWLNETLRKMFPEGVPLGSKCYDIAENRNKPCEDCGAIGAFADGRIHITERYNAKIDKWVQIVSLPIRDEVGKVVQVLEATTDITDRKRIEQARDRYLGELEALKAQLEAENIYLKEEIEDNLGFKEIVGRSNAICYVLEKVRQVAETDATVLVQGETGVGKELVARAIHRISRRSQKPFVTVNCAALPANLVETELFGHEPGAFTGAERLRKGRFELADGGTIFLDEISELPFDAQSKLLRVLQEGRFERVGSSTTLSVNVRIITATNRNLKNEVAAGTFRADLFYRLNVYPITVPPLRKRHEDIPLLVQHFVPEIAGRIGKRIDQIPVHLMEQVTARDWPGNVRELKNFLERAVITSPDTVLRLPEEIDSATELPKIANPRPDKLADLESVERSHILAVLKATDWRISGPKGAAKILGLNPSTLRFRMKKLGIRKNP